MRSVILILIAVLICEMGLTQSTDCGPLLADVKAKLTEKGAMSTTFELVISYPDQQTDKQSGKYMKSGDKSRIEMEDILIISDGKSNWMYMESANEVQISDAGEQMGVFSPELFISMYEEGEYSCDLSNSQKYGGKDLHIVECKPTDPDAEFFKARLSIDQATSYPYTFELFERSGTRYSLTFGKIDHATPLPESAFLFNPDDYPDIWVEDLRID